MIKSLVAVATQRFSRELRQGGPLGLYIVGCKQYNQATTNTGEEEYMQQPTTEDDIVAPVPNTARLTDMRQGEKVNGVFSNAEMERRISLLRHHMEQVNIAAVVLTSMHNICYFSGFLYCPFGRPYGLVVTHDKSVTLSAGIDGGQPWRRSHDDNVTFTDWQRDNFYFGIKQQLENYNDGIIGCEFDHLTIETYQKLEAALPSKAKVDVSMATMQIRMKKSKEELEVIRHGARIADIGGAAVVDAIEDGIPEYIVAKASTNAMVEEIACTFPQSEIRDTWTWFQSGLNTDGAHNPLTTKAVTNGDICSLNCFPMIAGYYTALERTLFLDHASDEEIRIWEINSEVHKRGLELIIPGARCSDIVMELNEIYAMYGLLKYRSFGYGHSFGVLSHYYGREAALELREDIDTKLEPNMVVSMEPMLMIPDGQLGAGGYREHDILIVTTDGAENLTKFPYGPDKMIIKK